MGGAARSPVGQDSDALFPCLGHLVGQIERGDGGVVALQVAPEQVGQHLGVVDQGAVVQDSKIHALGELAVTDDAGRGQQASGMVHTPGREFGRE